MNPLKTAILNALAKESVGLLLGELAERIPPDTYGNDRNKISYQLNRLLNAGDVEKGATLPGNLTRWKLTAIGRSAQSVLHDDDQPSAPPEPDPAVDYSDSEILTSGFEADGQHFNLTLNTSDPAQDALLSLALILMRKPPVNINPKIDFLQRCLDSVLIDSNKKHLIADMIEDYKKLEVA